MRPDASENSQINTSTIVRAAGAAGSQPHLASGFQGRCKIATLHAGFGVIRGMSVKLTFHLDHSYRVLKSMTLGRFPTRITVEFTPPTMQKLGAFRFREDA